MKILAIMGSPHRGNSLQATQRIEERLARYDDVEFEYVHLKDLELKPCRGCFVCFMKGDERCPVKDDKAAIAQKLEEADGVIFVSPVYSMHVSYLFKQFVDRFSCTFHRPCYWGKYALTVAVAGNIGLKETTKYLKDVAMAWGFEVVDELNYRMAPRNTSMRTIASQKDRTDEAVDRFYTAIKERRPRRLTFRDHFTFRIMQASYARLETMSPTDYGYWKEKGWLEPDAVYFHDNVRPNWLFDRLTRFMGWMTGRQIDGAIAQS
ncbi:MAG: NAD(P)H-dependent oxidoreductase [Anaerolineae bacterium]|jgi:multimeric flavodoxin WrbA